MSAHVKDAPARAGGDIEGPGDQHVNEVRLVGRLGAEPREVVLPSGDSLWTFRLTVARTAQAPGRATQNSDSLDCEVWRGRVKRSVGSWAEGDLVEVTGAIHKRFFRAGGALASRVEVEVTTGRLIRRAATG